MEKLQLRKIFLKLLASEIEGFGKTIDNPIILNCSKYRIIDCENCYIDKKHDNWFKSEQLIRIVGNKFIDEITVRYLSDQRQIEETKYFFDITAAFKT